MHRIHLATAALCVVAFIGSSALPALAAPGKAVAKGTVAPAGTAIPRDKAPATVDALASKTKPPAGYVKVHSALFAAPEDVQTSAIVTCPGKKVPLGGGVVIAGDDVNDNINSSYPSGRAWVADVNNDSFADTSFMVYAICANKPAGYQLTESAVVTNPADTQTEGFVTCPGSTVPWGGGFFSTSGNVAVNANSSYPTGDTSHVWNVYMNNFSTADAGFSAFAVCANKPRLYGQSFGSGTSNPFGQDSATGTCGAGQVVTGGGDFSSSTSLVVNMNSTEPTSSTTWRTWTNNNTPNTYSFSAYAVCVGL